MSGTMHLLNLKYIDIRRAMASFFVVVWVASIPLKNSIYEVSMASFVLLALVSLLMDRDFRILYSIPDSGKKGYYLIASVLLSTLISNVFHLESLGEESWGGTVTFWYRFAMVPACLLYLSLKNYVSFKTILAGALVGLGVQVVAGYIHYLQIVGLLPEIIHSDFGYRVIGLAREPNVFGFFMGLGVLLTAWVLLVYGDRLSKFQQVATILFGLALLGLVALSYSRASWLALSVGLGFLAWKESSRRGREIILASLLAGCSLAALIFPSVIDRFESIFDLSQNQDRLGPWRHAMALIADRPFLGHGMGVSLLAAHAERLGGLWSLHNIVLEILFHTGMLGLACWIALLYWAFRTAWVHNLWLGVSVLSYWVVDGMFSNSIFYAGPYIAVLGLVIVFLMSGERESSQVGCLESID